MNLKTSWYRQLNRPLAPLILLLTQVLGFNVFFGLSFKFMMPIDMSLMLTLVMFGLSVWFLIWNLLFLSVLTDAQHGKLILQFKEYWIWLNYFVLVVGILVWYFTSVGRPIYL